MQIHKIDEWPNLVLWRPPSTSLSSHRPRLLLDLGSVPTQVTQVPSFILATLHCHFLLKFDICHAFVTSKLGHRGVFFIEHQNDQTLETWPLSSDYPQCQGRRFTIHPRCPRFVSKAKKHTHSRSALFSSRCKRKTLCRRFF